MDVLVCDDESEFGAMVGRICELAGADVAITGSARDAVRRAGEQPTLALLDVHMPAAGGLEIVDEIRRAAPAAVIIVTSAALAPDYARQAMAAGADSYFDKLVLARELPRLLSTVVTFEQSG